MSDWQVGDRAVHCPQLPQCEHCYDDGTDLPGVFTVVEVAPYEAEPPGLDFAEAPCGAEHYCACRFRKVTPDKHEACEEEFVTLLRKSKVRA